MLAGGRAVRRLKELLVAEADRRGLRLVPPAITTPGALPERLYAAARPAADGLMRRRVYARVLRELLAGRATTLLGEPPAAEDVRGWAALARHVDTLHREVGGAALRFGDVADRCDAQLLYDDSERWRLLARAQHACVAELERLGFSDLDHARIAAVERGALACDRDLWLVGVPDLPVIVRRMLGPLLRAPAAAQPPTTAPPQRPARVRVLVHAPPDADAAFDEIGCVRAAYWTGAEVPLADTQIELVERPSDQAAAVLRFVAALDARFAADEIVIGVTDAEVVPYVEERLAEAAVETRYAAGAHLERSPVFRLLDAVADYLDGRSVAAFASLVRHPDAGSWLARRGSRNAAQGSASLRAAGAWLEPLDAYLRAALPARLDGALPGPPGDPARAAMAALRRAVDALLRRTLGGGRVRRTLRDWIPDILALLVSVYGDDALDRDRPRSRRRLAALELIRAAAAAAHDVPPEWDEPCDAATAIRLLLDEAKGASIAPDPDRAAVEMLGWLELHLDDAPVAILTGANEPFLPESANADAFLPDSLRTRLGLVDNARRLARDAYQLTALLRSRTHVHVIAGRRSADGDPLRPSRLLLTARGPALAARVRHLLGEPETASSPEPTHETGAAPTRAADETTNGAPTSGAGGNRSRFRLPPQRVLRADHAIDTLRVTDFALLLQDPYGFALQRILRLEPLDDAALELDPRSFGILAHDVLYEFGRSEDVHSAEPTHVVRTLDELLDAVAARRFGSDAHGRPAAHAQPAVRLQIEQLRARLHAFAGRHAARVAAGWRVVGSECGTAAEGALLTIAGETIRVRGRIDRIEYHETRGEYAVFDYKTGEQGDEPDAVHRRGRAAVREWQDLQLPLYRHLLPHVRTGNDADAPPVVPAAATANVRLGYILLCRDVDRIGFVEADWSDADLADADARAAAVIRMLRANEFVFDPRVRPRDAAFDALLGRHRLAAAVDEDLDAEEAEAAP